MKIVILNGSPKGNELSVTMHYIYYIEKIFPEHEFKPLNVGQLLTNMRIRDETLQKILDEIKNADGIIWSFPVYTTLVPAQLKKFIEILFEKGSSNIFKDKYSIVLTTSMNFYDHTAHNYMHAIVEDLGSKYVGFYSASMFDLLKYEKRLNWYHFMTHYLQFIKNKTNTTRRFSPIKNREFVYQPNIVAEDQKLENNGKKIIVLTDYTDSESNTAKMVYRFKESFKDNVEIHNFNDVNIKGGCLGCCKCGMDNQCVYKDDFTDFFNNNKNTDVLVYAGTMVDRFLSYHWKVYLDRGFHNGHTPAAEGTQMCFLISGSLSQNENLREWISAISELGFGNLVDVVTDEFGDSKEIDDLIYLMAKKAIEFSKFPYISPPTFLKVGGYKIFRDMIYGLPGAIFRMDYKFFKNRKMFDFPTKNKGQRFGRAFLGFILKSKKARHKFKAQMTSGMILPFSRTLKKINFEKENEKLRMVN